MRALRFDRFGPPSVLKVEELPAPVPSADEALVEVRAAGINPSDVKNVEGRMPQTKPPRTPGRDFAGVVVDGPVEWRGAEVWGTGGDLGFTRDGTHAEAVTIPIAALRRKPSALSFEEAAAVGTPFLTAHLGLTRAGLKHGDGVLVTGATGAVGSAAVQLARWAGARVIARVRNEDEARIAQSLGAHEVVVSPVDVTPVQIAFDTTGELLDESVHTLAHGGCVVAISAPADGRTSFDLRALYRRDGRIVGIDSLRLSSVEAADVLDALAPGFESGALKVPAVTVWPLDEAARAYAAKGKPVLVPHRRAGGGR